MLRRLRSLFFFSRNAARRLQARRAQRVYRLQAVVLVTLLSRSQTHSNIDLAWEPSWQLHCPAGKCVVEKPSRLDG